MPPAGRSRRRAGPPGGVGHPPRPARRPHRRSQRPRRPGERDQRRRQAEQVAGHEAEARSCRDHAPRDRREPMEPARSTEEELPRVEALVDDVERLRRSAWSPSASADARARSASAGSRGRRSRRARPRPPRGRRPSAARRPALPRASPPAAPAGGRRRSRRGPHAPPHRSRAAHVIRSATASPSSRPDPPLAASPRARHQRPEHQRHAQHQADPLDRRLPAFPAPPRIAADRTNRRRTLWARLMRQLRNADANKLGVLP